MTAVSYHVKTDSAMEQVDQMAWDSMCANRPFATAKWLLLLEKTMADYKPSYLQLWNGDRLVAGAVCQPQRHFHLSAYLKNPLLHKVASKTLAVLPPFASTLPLFLRDGLLVHPEADTAVWLPLLLREIEKEARQRWAPFTYLGNLRPQQSSLIGQGSYTIVPILQDSYINVEWQSFDAYLTHLNAKRRKIVKVSLERAEKAGVRVEETDFSSPLTPKISQLIRGVAENHDNVFLYRPDFLHLTHGHLHSDDYTVLVACIQDKLVGCATLFRSGEEVAAKWTGLDYELTRKTYTYHSVVIHVVKKAIELGARRLDIGPTSYVLKRQLGGTFEDRFAALKVGIRPLNAAVQVVTNRPKKAAL